MKRRNFIGKLFVLISTPMPKISYYFIRNNPVQPILSKIDLVFGTFGQYEYNRKIMNWIGLTRPSYPDALLEICNLDLARPNSPPWIKNIEIPKGY